MKNLKLMIICIISCHDAELFLMDTQGGQTQLLYVLLPRWKIHEALDLEVYVKYLQLAHSAVQEVIFTVILSTKCLPISLQTR